MGEKDGEALQDLGHVVGGPGEVDGPDALLVSYGERPSAELAEKVANALEEPVPVILRGEPSPGATEAFAKRVSKVLGFEVDAAYLWGDLENGSRAILGGTRPVREGVKELYGEALENAKLTECDASMAEYVAGSTGCDHRPTGSGQHAWLEIEAWGRERGLRQNPFCVKCGVAMNVTSDRGKGLGYFSNLLGHMKKQLDEEGRKLADVQIRLIMKEMEGADVGDTWSATGTQQMEFFVEAVKKYTGLTEAEIERLTA